MPDETPQKSSRPEPVAPDTDTKLSSDKADPDGPPPQKDSGDAAKSGPSDGPTESASTGATDSDQAAKSQEEPQPDKAASGDADGKAADGQKQGEQQGGQQPEQTTTEEQQKTDAAAAAAGGAEGGSGGDGAAAGTAPGHTADDDDFALSNPALAGAMSNAITKQQDKAAGGGGGDLDAAFEDEMKGLLATRIDEAGEVAAESEEFSIGDLLDKRVDEVFADPLFTPTPAKPAWIAAQHSQANEMSARLAEMRKAFASTNHGTVTVQAKDGTKVQAEAPPPSKASVQAAELLSTAAEYHSTQGGQAAAITRAEWVPPEIIQLRAVCDSVGQGIPPEKQAKAQYGMAMHLLGKMGPKPARPLAGAISNDEQAHKYLHEAATKGQVQAQVMLGGRMESSGDIAGAQRWYLMAAEGGDPHLSASERGASSAEAQCRLGGLYSAGKAGDRAGDYSHGSEAQRWYLKAATNPDGPNAEAMYQLGLAYEGGSGKAASGDDGTRTGASIDYAKAMTWHKKAAEQGHEGGRKAVGMMYRHGKGVPKDFDTAQMWWKGTM